jgi:electron transfer flavoprotein alpha subunit
MPGTVWAIAELGSDGLPTRLALEIATSARVLAGVGGGQATAIVVAPDPDAAAASLAAFAPVVKAVRVAGGAEPTPTTVAGVVAALASQGEPPDVLLLGATPDGREMAGILAARLRRGVLANATGLAWGDGTDGAPAGPRVEMSVLGGRAVTISAFADGRGIVTVRPNVVTAEATGVAGTVEAAGAPAVPASAVRVVARADTSSRSAGIEEARVVVSGGRGLGGPAGVALLQDLATILGGAVAATRAAVDAGWLPYAVQIGQTGKTIRPSVYLAAGVSGAIQHRVGMQDAETIIAINRDPDAPLAEHADLYVVGDLFEVVPALLAALRARGA